MRFDTANGSVSADETVGLDIDELGERVFPYILPSTPALLSVGRRCMKMGYDFIWKRGQEPYFITPSGKVVVLEVIGDIPYIAPGEEKHIPREIQEEDLIIQSRPACPVVARGVMGEGEKGGSLSSPVPEEEQGGISQQSRACSRSRRK